MLKPPNITPGIRPTHGREMHKEVAVDGVTQLMRWHVQDNAEHTANCRFFGSTKRLAEALAVIEGDQRISVALASVGLNEVLDGVRKALLAAGYTEEPDEA